MTWMKYVTDPTTGCCTVKELLDAAKADPTIKEVLKKWAIEEMRARGIEFEDSSK